MAVKIKVNDHLFQADREQFEERLVAAMQDKLAEAEHAFGAKAALIKTAVKSAVSMMFSFQGIRQPQGVNTLDFAMEYLVKMVLDALENMEKPLELKAQEVKEDA